MIPECAKAVKCGNMVLTEIGVTPCGVFALGVLHTLPGNRKARGFLAGVSLVFAAMDRHDRIEAIRR
jgi:hypothetical protein